MPCARHIDNPKMRELRELLADGDWHSSWEITRKLRIVDLTLLRELRQHGYHIECSRDGHIARYRYTTADLERHLAAEKARLTQDIKSFTRRTETAA